MELQEVMSKLENLGSEQTRKIFGNHGCKEPMFGVKIGDMKKLVKVIKKNHELGLKLYETGNYDARYLAHYIVEPKKMTVEVLSKWMDDANCYMLSEYAVSSVTAESNVTKRCIDKWLKEGAQETSYKLAGAFATYSQLISITPDEELDLEEISHLMWTIKNEIHQQRNRVKYTMNSFIIAVGSYIEALSEEALAVADEIGKVDVYMGKTACKVSLASDTIMKIRTMGRLGKKRKKAIC